MDKPKTNKRIKRYSGQRAKVMRIYFQRRRWFLAAHPWCAWGLMQRPVVHLRSEDVHHTRGRIGRLLLDERYWLAVSRSAHNWIHENIAAARKLGLICEKGKWGCQL